LHWTIKGLLVLVVLFPYFLYRFATALAPHRRGLGATATGVSLLVTVSALTLPQLPSSDDHRRPWWLLVLLVLIVLQWGFLSIVVATRLWAAGRGRPTVARRRMQVLSLGSFSLLLALAPALWPSSSDTTSGAHLAGQLIGILAATLFYVGLVPPGMLRASWRRRDDDALHDAEVRLLQASTAKEVAGNLLPHLATMLGGQQAVLFDRAGRSLGAIGLSASDIERWRQAIPKCGPSGEPVLVTPGVVSLRLANGWLAVETGPYTPFFGREEARALMALGAFIDLALTRAELHQQEQATNDELQRRADELERSQAIARVGSWQWDFATGASQWSDELYRLYGFEVDAERPHYDELLLRVHPDDRATVDDAVKRSLYGSGPFEFDYRIVLETGQVRWLHARGGLEIANGVALGMVGTAQDITDQRIAEQALAHQALHDPLTKLPNRALLLDRLAQALARQGRHACDIAVLFLDIDRFKWINDSLGHAAGDQLLIEVANRLTSAARGGDTVARFGGDEFVVLCEDVAGEKDSVRLAERFAQAISAPVALDDAETTPTASIGIAIALAGDGYNPETLVRDADAAMYQAKERGRDRYEVFGAATRERVTQRLELESQLRRAIESGDIAVYYQPEVDLARAVVTGVEALARWRHPDRGLILPMEFIGVAEETGLIAPLGSLVLETACRQAAEWQARAGLRVAVNLSARQLLAPGLLGTVRRILDASGLAPDLLCIEITESILLADAQAAAAALGSLKDLGVRIAVDDFGTGYSSLLYLKQLPVDILKIDQSFVDGLGRSREDRAIVAGVIDLAHAFGISTTAEGVEGAAQLAVLRQLGCEQAQGFYWSPALPADQLQDWLQAHPPAGGSLPEPSVPAGRKVLVVDDDRSLRRVLRLALAADPTLDVREAADGREAVALAGQYQPDVVLLDLAMPGMGGLEALPLILAVARQAKVIILSSMDPSHVARRVAVDGAVAFLGKDDLDRLVEHIEQLFVAAA
jgi:diguanylate cyclase (GGDEF)-like protein